MSGHTPWSQIRHKKKETVNPYELAVFRFLKGRATHAWRINTLCDISEVDIVQVRVNAIEGYQTCFNCDPNDYGSQDYGPYVIIEVIWDSRGVLETNRLFDFDFTLGELVEGACKYLEVSSD